MVEFAGKAPPVGSKHHFSKITEDDVRKMRAAFDAGASVDTVHRDHGAGLSHSSVEKICHRLAWKHVK
jgi:hypothetical protein